MATATLLSDDLLLPEQPTRGSHPMDSSGILLGLMTLSRRAEAAVENGSESDSLDGVISKGVLRSLLSALHFRDVATVRHSRRVAMLAVGLAQYLGWEGRHLKLLEIASLLHDIGKIGVPDNVLFKPGALNPDEEALMSLHHNIGVDVLQACRVDKEVLDIVGQSHCHYNGANDGYRRIGGDVHQGARILGVADAYDSLRTDQVYRNAQAHDEIMKVLMASAGTQFDGNVVCALSRWIENGGSALPAHAPETGRGERPPGPADPQESLEASSLGHIFAYLYLLESMYDGFYLVDSDLRFVVWNRGAESLLGRPAQQILNQMWTSRVLSYADRNSQQLPDHQCPLNQVVATRKSAASIVRMRHADGNWVEVELQSVPLLDPQGRLQGVAEIFRDVSRNSRRPQEYRELKMAASRDPLTSVANRGELETQLALMLSEFSQSPDAEPFSVIFLDVDHFKSINDTYGHGVGDQVLIDLTKLLQHETYSGELVGRYGGEEFVVLCPGAELDQTVRRAERFRVALGGAKIAELSDCQVTASFGVTQVERGDSVESILRRADRALYKAKGSGRNRTCSFTNSQLLFDDLPTENGEEDEPADPFVFTGSFSACVAADMVVYKLGGFVDDRHVKLLEVAPRRAVMRLGSRGLLPFWGGSDQSRPVELEIEFSDEPIGIPRGKFVVPGQVCVNVRIRPLGWIRHANVFQERAARVLKDLRAYFAGH